MEGERIKVPEITYRNPVAPKGVMIGSTRLTCRKYNLKGLFLLCFFLKLKELKITRDQVKTGVLVIIGKYVRKLNLWKYIRTINDIVTCIDRFTGCILSVTFYHN